jgi:glycosyltransferase involved in cell wall biosynthesis
MPKNEMVITDFVSNFKAIDIPRTEQLPKMSIVTPSFNQGSFLEKTIVSVLNQNYPNLEYIIYDGGSTDNSVEIIRKYQKYLKFWKSEPDKGQSDAIAKGFAMATGDILAWLNSDDVYWPGALHVAGRFFAQHPTIDVIYGNSYTIDDQDRILRETRSVKFSKYGFLTRSFSLHQASMFWRRQLYQKVEGVDLDLSLIMDIDLWVQFFKAGAVFKHVNHTLSCYRSHKMTKANLFTNDIGQTFVEIMKKRFNIDINNPKWRIIRIFMRLRTLILHMAHGRLAYLIKNVGVKC